MSDSVKVYRAVYASVGGIPRGIFCSGKAWDYNEARLTGEGCNSLCPLPESDSTAIRDIMSSANRAEYYFGFESLQHLENVFPCKKGRIACDNVFIVVYEIDKQFVVFGKKQMVMKLEYAKLAEVLNFVTYDKMENVVIDEIISVKEDKEYRESLKIHKK